MYLVLHYLFQLIFKIVDFVNTLQIFNESTP